MVDEVVNEEKDGEETMLSERLDMSAEKDEEGTMLPERLGVRAELEVWGEGAAASDANS